MVPLKTRFQCLQDLKRRILTGFFHIHRTEPPIQGSILLDEFSVLLPGSGAQHLKFSPAQGRFEDIGRINSSLRRTRTDDGVHLIDEQDHIPTFPDLR